MDNFCVPPSAAWYTHATCAPDNGVLYLAGNRSSIAYIPVRNDKGDASAIKVIHLHQQIKSFVCDTNWLNKKWFITLNEQHVVAVWSLDTEKICKGHKAHFEYFKKQDTSKGRIKTVSVNAAMCITKNRHILSIDANTFVKYCIASNTYSLLPDNFITKRNTVSILKASPYDENMIAIGHKNGLMMVANIRTHIVTHVLRAHDTHIVSLEWMLIDETVTNSDAFDDKTTKAVDTATDTRPKGRRKTKAREPPKPIVDADDMFDMYSYDYAEEEFGTMSRCQQNGKDSNDSLVDEKIANEQIENTNDEHFDFVEACQTLRDEITAGKLNNKLTDQNEELEVNISDVRKIVKLTDTKSDTEVSLDSSSVSPQENIEEASNHSTIGSSHDEVEFAEIENKLDSMELNGELKVDDAAAKDNRQIYLASSAQEPFVVIWDTNTGNICKRIQLKTQSGKLAIPKPICTVTWISPTNLIVSSPNGNLSKWLIRANSDRKITECVEDKLECTDKAIVDITSISFNAKQSFFWTFSMHFQINCYKITDNLTELIASYSTLPIGMCSIRESPHDPNRIAIAGNNKRISLLDLTTLKPNNIQMQAITSKIQGKVLALSWHPKNENYLAFSTNEGRIGVSDINKPTNPPDLINNFCGKDLYRISYGYSSEPSKHVLFAYNDKHLMLFPAYPKSYTSETYPSLEFPVAVSSVSASQKYLAVGTNDGVLRVLTLDHQEIHNEKLSKKYISEIAWSNVNPEKLAVCSAGENIFILENASIEPGKTEFRKVGELIGHEQGLTWVKWSNESENRLVSTSFDHTVRVWDTQAQKCIALKRYDSKMYCAIFMPSNENFVVCSGQSETLHIFDIRTHPNDLINTAEGKKKEKTTNADTEWATIHQNDLQALKAVEKKRLRNIEKKMQKQAQREKEASGIDEISNNLQSVILVNEAPTMPLKANFTTLFYLSNKELNRSALSCLHDLLKTGNTEDKDKYLNIRLFSNREDVQHVLEKELINHRNSNTDSIGHLLIPQMNHNLKQVILDEISAKKLTEQHIALAPSISYEFWKSCCNAFALQCIEKHLTLQAMSYLLAIHDISETINMLCEAHYYREAWIVAKLYREAEETKLFESISDKWINHLETQGHLEGAALIAFLSKRSALALDIFGKRKTLTPEIQEIVELLKTRVQEEIE